MWILLSFLERKIVVRIVEVIATAHPDSTTEDAKWEYVVIKAIKPVNRPVTLEQIKTHPEIEKIW